MSATTLTLTDFLLARLDEDYETAWGAEMSPWRMGEWDGEFNGPREVLGRLGDVTAVCYYGGTYGHVMRFDPTRVLADIEAKRRIVERCQPLHVNREVDAPSLARAAWDVLDTLNAGTLRLLALPYADHADYDESWRP